MKSVQKKKKKKVGRPPLYQTPEALQEKINEYFDKGIPVRKVITGPPNNRVVSLVNVPTITGLCLYLGFESREAFYHLEANLKFCYTIKKARTRIEQEYEEQLQCGLGAGAIFALKNFGWKDEQYLKSNMPSHVIINFHSDGKPEPDNNRHLLPATQTETFPRG